MLTVQALTRAARALQTTRAVYRPRRDLSWRLSTVKAWGERRGEQASFYSFGGSHPGPERDGSRAYPRGGSTKASPNPAAFVPRAGMFSCWVSTGVSMMARAASPTFHERYGRPGAAGRTKGAVAACCDGADDNQKTEYHMVGLRVQSGGAHAEASPSESRSRAVSSGARYWQLPPSPGALAACGVPGLHSS